MWNGIVNVQQIQRFGLEDLEHFGGERQGVGWVIEKRVRGDLDFVEKNVRVVQVHADGRGVADEMNVVAAGGELLAKLGGDDAGAAVGGVAGDADLHERGSPVSSVVSRGQIVQHSTGKGRHCGQLDMLNGRCSQAL
jgi:hypothetical protein